jgi:hypothetical protein
MASYLARCLMSDIKQCLISKGDVDEESVSGYVIGELIGLVNGWGRMKWPAVPAPVRAGGRKGYHFQAVRHRALTYGIPPCDFNASACTVRN